MNGRHTPPTIAPTLVLEPPELLLPLPVSVGVFVGETMGEPETTDGSTGVASGSLPAAFATVALNEPFYTYLIKQMKCLLVECTYGPVYKCPVWDCTVEGNSEGVSACDNKPQNWDEENGAGNSRRSGLRCCGEFPVPIHQLTGQDKHCHKTVTRMPS